MGGKLVLVVDDNRLIRVLVQASIKSLDCQIAEAVDGEDALVKALELKPDVIVLDVVMPKMNGFEVLERLRGNDRALCPRIIMLTTAGTETDHQHARSSGADAYLQKPFDHNELRDVVSGFLQA